jgi:hypothetical protein
MVSAFASAALMFVFWEEVNPAAIFFFITFLIATDLFLNLRWRVSLICRQCGFDPSVYMKNPEMAAQRVKAFLERRKIEPRFLLSRPLNLPKKVVQNEKNAHATLSRSVAQDRALVNGAKSLKGKFVSKSV